MLKIKFKKVSENAVIPKFARKGDAGMDIVATDKFEDEYGNICYKTGLSCEFSENYVGLLCPRGSVAKYGLILSDCVGVLDSGFRGEILIKFKKVGGGSVYNVGDRIAQLVFVELPKIEIEEVSILSDSERGSGSFGSTGS